MRVVTVVGARPQFVKAATISRAIARWNQDHADSPIEESIVHTGQHYDENMSRVFFDELQIPPPEVNLEIGSASHGRQTGRMLESLERVMVEGQPDLVLIYGDTNSTLAGALAAVKLHIPVAHVEAGLRSFNRRMPEEINRVVADHVSALLLCPSDLAVENLRSEGLTEGVHQVGDVMYDSVLYNRELSRGKSDVLKRLNLQPKGFYLATIHRAENTDDPARLGSILAALRQIDRPIVLPLHPRTKNTLGSHLAEEMGKVIVTDPVPYLDMLTLEDNASLILTDSGGVQKEAYFFGVPCVTLRDETEWVELVETGWNQVVGADPKMISDAIGAFEARNAQLPPGRSKTLYGDGHAAQSIVELLIGA